jgi:hypothetical protein
MGMNGSPERGGGTEKQVVGFKEAPLFGRGGSLRMKISYPGFSIGSGRTGRPGPPCPGVSCGVPLLRRSVSHGEIEMRG